MNWVCYAVLFMCVSAVSLFCALRVWWCTRMNAIEVIRQGKGFHCLVRTQR